ncbi:MAG: sirohydrochlorin chelatase [Halochromatium sp.]
MPTIMLVDNGSSRADATLALRRLSDRLAQRLGQPVHPVSLAHSSKVPAKALGGRPAATLEPFLRRQAAAGVRDFLAVPLFFGPSRALTRLIPQTVERVGDAGTTVRVAVAEELCPLPRGEPRLAEILDRSIRTAMRDLDGGTASSQTRIQALLVDHGSPMPEVSAVRHWLAGRLEILARGDYQLGEAAMERRAGAKYAFNGALLAEALAAIGQQQGQARVVIGMQFIGPGRHAGRDGDIERICQQARDRFPGLDIALSPLVGEDEALIDLLVERAEQGLQGHRGTSLPRAGEVWQSPRRIWPRDP